MKLFAICLFLILLCPLTTHAQSSPASVIAASKCDGLAKACSAAANEIIAARKLIAGYEDQIIASNDRIEAAKKEIESLKQLSGLQSSRAAELEKVIAAEREAKSALVGLKEAQAKRIANLERRLGRARKFTLITGVAAAVGILVAVAK